MDDGSIEKTVQYKTGTVIQITSLDDGNKFYYSDLNGETGAMFIDTLKPKDRL